MTDLKTLPSDVKLYVRAPNGSITDYGQLPGINLIIEDETPSGFTRAQFTICNPNNNLPQLGSKVWVWDETNHAVLWLGRVGSPDIDYNGSTTINCDGYVDSMEDNGFNQSKVYPAGSSFNNIVNDAFGSTIHQITGGVEFIASGLNIAEDTSDYALQTLKQVLEHLVALTSPFATPMIYQVWEQPSTTEPRLYISFADLISARYRIMLNDEGPKVSLRSKYDIHAIANVGVVQWGNQQFVIQPPTISYSALPNGLIRSKRVNAENDVRVQYVAENMALGYVDRFNVLRAVSDTIEICSGAPFTAIPPVTTVINNTYPLRMVRSGYPIDIMNIPSRFGPYIHPIKFVVGKHYSFETDTLELQCGEIVSIGTAMRNIQASLTSRPFVSAAFSAISNPLVDNDQLPTFGPTYNGISPPSLSSGIPTFVKAPNDERAPNGAVVHPNLIYDFGLEANHTIGDLSAGPKGGIKTVPGLYTTWDGYFDNDDATDTINLELYKKARVPDNSPLVLIDTLRVIGHTHGSGTLKTAVNMLNGDRFFFKVIEPEPATAQIFSISIKGPKRYPGLKL